MKEILLFYSVLFILPVNAQSRKFSFQQPKMGSMFMIILSGQDSLEAASAADRAFKLVDTLNDIYSDYLPGSELNKLCSTSGSGKWQHVSTELFSIISTAIHAAGASKGSFDITAGPLIRLWRQARKNSQMPSRQSLDSAKAFCGYKLVEMDHANRSIRLKKKGMQLDLGGIAKGETAQRVINRLREMGFPSALIDAGGDIACSEAPAGAKAWKIAVNLPGSEDLMPGQLLLQNMAVTTSGDLYQYVILNGKRFSHIIDPRTGYALTGSRNVTVISPSGIDADWLTKACSILPVRDALSLVASFPSSEVQIAFVRNDKLVLQRSNGFVGYLKAENNNYLGAPK